MKSSNFAPLASSGRRFAVDLLLCILGYAAINISPLLRSAEGGLYPASDRYVALGLFALIAAGSIQLWGSHRTIWRYVSFKDMLTLLRIAVFSSAALVVIELLVLHPASAVSGIAVSWRVVLLAAGVMVSLAAPRVLSRILFERRFAHNLAAAPEHGGATPVLMSGALERIDSFIRECGRDPNASYKVVGVFSEDSKVHGSSLNGVPVLGEVSDIKNVVGQLEETGIFPKVLVLAKDDATQADVEKLLDLTTGTNLKIGRLPKLGTFYGETPIRPIELSDLLGRPEVVMDAAPVASMIEGKCVMVTGAGGSIGSELCRQISRLRPSTIVIVDFSEFNLYRIDQELEETFPSLPRKVALLDVREGHRVQDLVKTMQPDLVFHAAALKHVPLLEDQPIEAIKTNVLGTVNVAEACRMFGVKAMVTISTDKAVNPTNVMGATKRLAEAYCQGIDQAAGERSVTRFMTVRFGNVLGSAGSVVPLFQRQIEAGGPVTVTHSEITRFFMTIPEAVALVLQAGAHGIDYNSDRGSIYVLDMGRPIRILDLAKQMIRLAGRRPDVDVKIKVIGLRPGEKLYEEVMHDDESISKTSLKSILKVIPRATDLRIINQQLVELRGACATNDNERAVRLIKIAVPEFHTPERTRGDADLPIASEATD